MIRRIVYATDFSKASQPAFAKALDLAKANRAVLHIVHVMTPVVPMTGDGYITPSTFEALERSGRAWAQKEMGRLLDKARRARVKVDG
jgi:nucleotide-binding universal stress UspA family protein